MTESPVSFWGLSIPAMDQIFSADRVVGAMLRFEAALAGALADTGIAPEAEAEAVVAACQEPVDGAGALLAATWDDGTPLIGVTNAIRSRLGNDGERGWVHYGATTQDAVDTAHMLLAREAFGLLNGGLTTICQTMRDLVVEHRDQAHMARTFLQDARPTTFGYRVAGWLESTLTNLDGLRATRDSLACQLGGPAGNLAAYGTEGTAVVAALAERLDLEAPDLPWHTDRSRVRNLVTSVENSVTTLAKVAADVGLLAQTAVGEVTVRSGGSSSMPGKENPIDAVRALAAADVCHGAASMITRARPHELDRALGSWHSEWAAVPLVFSSASAVVESVGSLLEGLEVDSAAMGAAADDVVPDIDPSLIDGVLERWSQLVPLV